MNKFKINTSLIVDGDFDVKGTTSTIDIQNLTVKDNLIMVQGQNQAMTGIVADNGAVSPRSLYVELCKFNTSNTLIFPEGLSDREYLISGTQVYIDGTTYNAHKIVIRPSSGYFGIVYYIQRIEMSLPLYSNGNWQVASNFAFEWVTFTESSNLDSATLDLLYEFFDINKADGSHIVLNESLGRIAMASPVLVGDTLKIGEGIATKDENGNIISFEFNEGSAQSIATRDDDILNNAILSWDSNKNTIKDSGILLNINGGTGENSIIQVNTYEVEEGDNPATGTWQNQATSPDAIAFGIGSLAANKRAIAIGNQCIADGNTAFSTGQVNKNHGNGAFMWGAGCEATMHYSIVGGNDVKVETGNYSVIEGLNIKHTGERDIHRSTIFGSGHKLVGGKNLFLSGYNNRIVFNEDIIQNDDDTISMMGSYLKNKETDNGTKIILGEYNKPNDGTLLELGWSQVSNRTNDAWRGNALEVYKDGTFKFLVPTNTVDNPGGWQNYGTSENNTIIKGLADKRVKVYGAPIEPEDVVRLGDVDSDLSRTSIKPVQNKVITKNLNLKADRLGANIVANKFSVDDSLIMLKGNKATQVGTIVENYAEFKSLEINNYQFDTTKEVIFPDGIEITYYTFDSTISSSAYSGAIVEVTISSSSKEISVRKENGGFEVTLYKNGIWYGKPTIFTNISIDWIFDAEQASKLESFLKENYTTGSYSFIESNSKIAMAAPVLVGDTLKIGKGIADVNSDGNITDFRFDAGAAQALATRADVIEDGNLLVWDANKHTIVDSGKKVTEISGGGTFITVDTELSTESENPVQNKVITKKLTEIVGDIEILLSEI